MKDNNTVLEEVSKAILAVRYYGGLYSTIRAVLRDLDTYLNKSYLDTLESEIKTAQALIKDILNDTDKDGIKRTLWAFAGKRWPQLFHLEKRDAEIWTNWMLAQSSKRANEIRKRVDRYAEMLAWMNNITKEIAYHVGSSLPIDADGLEQFFTSAYVQSDRWPEMLAAFRRFREDKPTGIEIAILFRGLNYMKKPGWIKQYKFKPGLEKFYRAIGVTVPKSIPRDTDCLYWIDKHGKPAEDKVLQPFRAIW